MTLCDEMLDFKNVIIYIILLYIITLDEIFLAIFATIRYMVCHWGSTPLETKSVAFLEVHLSPVSIFVPQGA